MQIWPAIDISDGKCIRLRQGDFAQPTVFSDDPVAVAEQFVQQGARRLHLVDLDGARLGSPQNIPAIAAIRARCSGVLQVGGGLRNESSVQRLLELGVDRAIVGTAAVKSPDLLPQLCVKFPGQIVLGLDLREGFVAIHGWQDTSSLSCESVLARFAALPIASVIVTDISTDGMLQGPNLPTMRSVQAVSPFPVIASGGVTTAKDVVALASLGLEGAIIGRALYEGQINLAEVLRISNDLSMSLPGSAMRASSRKAGTIEEERTR